MSAQETRDRILYSGAVSLCILVISCVIFEILKFPSHHFLSAWALFPLISIFLFLFNAKYSSNLLSLSLFSERLKSPQTYKALTIPLSILVIWALSVQLTYIFVEGDIVDYGPCSRWVFDQQCGSQDLNDGYREKIKSLVDAVAAIAFLLSPLIVFNPRYNNWLINNE